MTQSRSLFEPDVLLKDYFSVASRRGAAISSEKRLMLAVLENAVDCYRKYCFAEDAQGRQLFEEAEEWLLSTDRRSLFAFENVCEALELNPEYLRRGILAWREQTARAREANGGQEVPVKRVRATG